LQKIVTFMGNHHLLPQKQELKIIDHRIDTFWPEKDSVNVRWDVETTGHQMIFRVYTSVRVTDVRVFLAVLVLITNQLKPLLNRIRTVDKTFFTTYHAMASFLTSLNYLSDMMLTGYIDENLAKTPPHIIRSINSYILADIKKLSPETRVKTLIEELSKRVWSIIDFIAKNSNVLFLIEYYITPDIINFSKAWLKHINDILVMVRKNKKLLFFSIQNEETNEILAKIMPTVMLNSMQLTIYKDVLTMSYLEKRKIFSQMDIIHFKYGYNAFQHVELSINKRLNDLVSLGLLEKVGDNKFKLPEDIISILIKR